MPNPNTFEEASAATQGLFADGEQLSLADAAAEPSEQNAESASAPNAQPNDENTQSAPPETSYIQNELDKAAQTAEVAAQVATEKDGQLRKAMDELESLRQENQQLQSTIAELSKQNTENIVEEALKPPTLDINSLAFADEEAQKAAMAKYADEMSAYNRQELMKELSPALEFAKKGMHDAEKSEVISVLSQIPELSNIREMQPQLDRIIEKNKWLSSDDMPLDEKYINAYAMARGIDAINNPAVQSGVKEATPEELLDMYNNNPAFRELIEKQRLGAIKKNQQVPTFSASSGAVNAALDIKEKPKTLEEASERTRQMFGL